MTDASQLEPNLTSLFGLSREMGYTRSEFFRVLPSALSDHDFCVSGDLVTIAMRPGSVLIRVGAERERRLSDLVRFPVLPVTIEFDGVDGPIQARFLSRFDLSYMKGLG